MTDVNVNDVGELVGAITTLNGSSGPHSITLLGDDNDYIVAEPSGEMFGDLAFPAILQDITIYGQGRTITRALDAPKFRFFAVDAKYESTEGKLTLENLKLFNGDSDTNGGGALINDGETIIRDCHFSGNVAGTYGGVIYAGDGKPLLIENTTFSNNIAVGTNARGGAIYGSGNCDLTITDCVFFRNRVKGNGSQGSAIYIHVGALAAMSGSDISCNVVEESTNDEAVYNASSLQFNAENNWWGAADGPNGGGVSGSGQSIGGNVDASPFNDTSGSLDVVIWYNRKAAAEYAIGTSIANFRELINCTLEPNEDNGGFPQFSDDVACVVGFVERTPIARNYSSVLNHQTSGGATGSAIFISEAIHAGGLPMTFAPDDDPEDPGCDTSNVGGYTEEGWRYCLGENSATQNWKFHPGIVAYFTSFPSGGEIEEIDVVRSPSHPTDACQTPSNPNDIDVDTLHVCDVVFTANGTGELKGIEQAETALIELFSTGRLSPVEIGDYMMAGDTSHGWLIVGWGPIADTLAAIDSAVTNGLSPVRDETNPIPYVADFCFGTDNTDDGTGWLQDPRPRPFYSTVVSIWTNLTSLQSLCLRKGNVAGLGTVPLYDRFNVGNTLTFFHLPDSISVTLDRIDCQP